MAELQPLESTINGGAAAAAAATSLENPAGLTSKRQRRPSVRLGDIGDQPAATLRSKQWSGEFKAYRQSTHREFGAGTSKASKTRPLTNLGNGGDAAHETLDGEERNSAAFDGNLDLAAMVSRKGKDFKGPRRGGGGAAAKRVRSNWVSSRVDEGVEGEEEEEKLSGGEGEEEWFRDFDGDDGSESPLKDHSPVNSLETAAAVAAVDFCPNSDGGIGGQRRPIRARVSEIRDHGAIEMDGPSDTEGRDWKCGASVERNGVGVRECYRPLDDGIRMWLNGLGLGRYFPVFEIHEVDEEVLPLLTLEDLKDMGINAVGSRRKLFCAIQKLAKGFS
ncbi:hypothetical protein Sjap_016610 [Stephania japonica]|uniref:SAM domain-containing protein n=1 Tax=Stephania japonica TaxID=461633 RepID=A0AAP0IMJ3_9MAGN